MVDRQGSGPQAPRPAPPRPSLSRHPMLFLMLHHYGVVVNEVFWGLWLLPFGMLVWKSGFLPKFLGVLLIINGIAYVAQAVTGVLFPAIQDQQSNLLFPLLMGEVVTMLWLLIMGAKPRVPQPA